MSASSNPDRPLRLAGADWLRRPQTQAVFAALAAQGLCRAREFSLSRMVGEYEDLLYELTEVHAGSAARV